MASAILLFWLIGIAIAWSLVDQEEELDYTAGLNTELVKVCISMGSWFVVIMYGMYWIKNKIN